MDKKTEVINTARSLFTKFGYKRVSMDEIARESNVTKKTVYSYFKDKDELFEFFVKEELINMKNRIEKIENEEQDSFEKLHKMLISVIKYRRESEFINIMINESESFKTSKTIKFLDKIDSEIKDYIKEKLLVKMDNNEIKRFNPDLLSYMIYSLYVSFLFNYKNESISEEEISDTVLSILKDGLLV